MKKTLFISFITLISCSSCKDIDFPARLYRLQIDNRSDKTISLYLAIERPFEYPDTSIEKNLPETGFWKVETNKSAYFDSRKKWEEIYVRDLPNDTLSIFIFDADTIAHYDWETIRTGYKVLQRYDLSIEDIKKLDYQVPYPPTAEMAGMKMYP